MLRCPVAAWEGWEGWTTKRNPHEDSEWAAAGKLSAGPILYSNRASQSSCRRKLFIGYPRQGRSK
jgi:hypothetical protein